MTIKLLIADDHPIVRDGLRGIFTGEEGFEVVGEAANGQEAVALAEKLRPDVVLMDLRMPGSDGVGAITELAALKNPARCSCSRRTTPIRMSSRRSKRAPRGIC
jgi:YesN/AraC family two-component response regulator